MKRDLEHRIPNPTAEQGSATGDIVGLISHGSATDAEPFRLNCFSTVIASPQWRTWFAVRLGEQADKFAETLAWSSHVRLL
jgi:hypothetical protein